MEDFQKIIVAIGVLVLATILFAFPTQFLWNTCLIGAIDGIHPISFWQAFGINVLASVLFKPASINTKND